jgi:sugar/nucleoside kinase (ribokinase family)
MGLINLKDKVAVVTGASQGLGEALAKRLDEEGCKVANENGTTVLYDCGGLYQGVERLLKLTDVMIPSEEFALGHTKTEDVKEAAKKLYELYSPKVVVITRGKIGGLLYDGKEFFEYPAFLVKAVDSNGSGDVFHGAFAFAYTKKMEIFDCCLFSSAVSALKCTKVGSRDAVPSYEETLCFLKERGQSITTA